MNSQNNAIKAANEKCYPAKNRFCAGILWISVLSLFLSSCQQSSVPNLNPCLSISAVAGIPSYETIQADAFEDAAGRIRFKAASFGQIRLFFPVINTTGQLTDNVQWDRFKILYLDPDGNRDDFRVSAALHYLDATGNTPTVIELDSNDYANSAINIMSGTFNHDFDFINRYYYVEIRLFRKNTHANPWIGGLALCEQFQ